MGSTNTYVHLFRKLIQALCYLKIPSLNHRVNFYFFFLVKMSRFQIYVFCGSSQSLHVSWNYSTPNSLQVSSNSSSSSSSLYFPFICIQVQPKDVEIVTTCCTIYLFDHKFQMTEDNYNIMSKVKQSRYRPEVPRGFQEVKVPRLHNNGTGWC